ncbi:MAG: tryptophan 7-halogenase [Steroidobacteraceae bacterium]|nr:tryptophan 7-halogenase [Steroidobacteraceae bacterium]
MKTDVAILGGGLAGLTLALQLRQRFPDLSIVVLERHRHPVPEAAHKVGESSVEIAAHYFDTVLGLKDHLSSRQLKKFGFRFFSSEGRRDIDAVQEIGVRKYLSTPTYQIDRGIFENFLGVRALEAGVRFIDGVSVRDVDLGVDDGAHTVRYERGGATVELDARWLVDASGRAGILKRKLGLALENDHDVNSAWFRIGARIDVNEWSSNVSWRERCDPPDRWLSTNHLVGEGYWVWLIPLASGSHSVGIVADGRIHPLRRINSFERAMEWLREFQPLLADDIESKRDLLQDFAFLKHFSYGCRKLFSGSRWAITGEAGVFLDPFYSPGGDFIAISNTYITELIARDRAGQPVAAYARIYEQFFMSFYDSTMSLYRDQYRIFGDPEVLPIKVIWDYTYYWGVLCQLFFQHRLTDLPMLSSLRDELQGSMALNSAMQDFMRTWSAQSMRRNRPALLDQGRLAWFAELNRGLRDSLDDAAFEARIRDTTRQLDELAREIVIMACAENPGLDASAVLGLIEVRTGAAPAGMLVESAA